MLNDHEIARVATPREDRWLTGDDAGRFCASPEGNARDLDGAAYLDEVLEEAEMERQFSEDFRADNEQRPFWEGALAQALHEGEEAVLAPPALAGNKRKRGKAGNDAQQQQPPRRRTQSTGGMPKLNVEYKKQRRTRTW